LCEYWRLAIVEATMPESNQLHLLFTESEMTLEQLIRAGADWLNGLALSYGHGTDNALDESAWIALEACELSPVEAVDDYSMVVQPAQLARARQWYQRRGIEHIPVAYLTGRCWFAGLEFLADERALIPRSPIAELIGQRFEPWLSTPPARILDLCCGGGCIGIATALAFETAQVDGADLSADALALAQQNAELHRVEDRFSLYQGDLFNALPTGARYDLIVSNPPYVDRDDLQQMGSEYHHEPRLGLAAGDDGLDVAHRILAQAADRITPDGVLVVEVGNSQHALQQYYPQVDFIWLEFASGGHGVFLLHRAQLEAVVATG
jgi:ribosomal protein L3 glutamine methyltransferase